MNKEKGFAWKLGMFVIIGLLLFVSTIYYVGKQNNLFGDTFHLKTTFKNVSGLKEGNNVRFSGINVGTVNEIIILTDTSVLVDLILEKKVMKFIRTDAVAGIGSDGLMGDKILVISPGTVMGSQVKDNDNISSKTAIEISDVMASLKTSVDNAGIITGQLAQFSYKMNNGNGALSKLISDETFSNSIKNTLTNLQTSSNEFAEFTSNLNDGALAGKLDSTLSNLQSGTKGLSDNMDAVKNSFLLRGYFKKQKKAAATKKSKTKKEAAKKKTVETINPADSTKL